MYNSAIYLAHYNKKSILYREYKIKLLDYI